MNRCCITCKWFKDAHFSKTYVSPTCTYRGQDSAAWMRQNVCGIEAAIYYQPKEPETREGTESNHGIDIDSV